MQPTWSITHPCPPSSSYLQCAVLPTVEQPLLRKCAHQVLFILLIHTAVPYWELYSWWSMALLLLGKLNLNEACFVHICVGFSSTFFLYMLIGLLTFSDRPVCDYKACGDISISLCLHKTEQIWYPHCKVVCNVSGCKTHPNGQRTKIENNFNVCFPVQPRTAAVFPTPVQMVVLAWATEIPSLVCVKKDGRGVPARRVSLCFFFFFVPLGYRCVS